MTLKDLAQRFALTDTYGGSMQARCGPSKTVNPCHARGGEEGGHQVVRHRNHLFGAAQ
jgi:hypothetical protein